jgi:hypothetical protein
MNKTIKYPEVNVRMVGEDGNAFAILGRVTKALRKAGIDADEIKEFQKQATAGDYGNLLRTVMEWVETDNDNEDDEEEEG